MIERIDRLSSYQKKVALSQIREYIAGWDDVPANNVEAWIYSGDHYDEIHAIDEDNSRDDPHIEVLYKCECGALIVDYDDYSGREYDADRCPKCGRHYEE